MARSQTKSILAKALKARQELATELAAIDKVIAICRVQLRESEPVRDSRQEQFDLYEGHSSRSAHAAYIAELLEAARHILISEMRPMKRGELVNRLEESGYEVIGSDKNRVFGTNMWRSDKFVTIPGLGYWPVDMTLPD
ncbi:MAG: hypothetical protein ABW169_03485 [Sphingobium sp.]